MRYVKQVEIAASPERAWSVLADVERWPSWTPTVTALEVLERDGSRLRSGDRLRVSQPGLAATMYTVTGVDEGRRLGWESRRPGLRQAAEHEVATLDPSMTRATLTFEIDGPLGRLVSPLVATRVRRMVDSEAAALRDRVEAGSSDHER